MSEAVRRVLVTGANGHLGRRLIERLSGGPDPVPVRAVVRSERAAGALRELADAGRAELCILDVRDAEALAGAARECRAAVHLVGIILESARSRFEEAHVGTGRALAAAADRAGLERVVALSILGASPHSDNPCLASRAGAEAVLLAAKTPAAILRVPMVLGPGDFASRALRAQARARWVPLLRGGASREQPIDSDDVLAAVCSALALPGGDDAVLDLAGPESLSRRALLERAAALYGNRPRVLPVPVALARGAAAVLERLLGSPPVSRAMLGVLDHDDDIDPGPACARLGLELTPLDETLRRCVGPEAPE